ncbi:MAG: P-II family nitrogen regulator [Bacteroidota bacterium]
MNEIKAYIRPALGHKVIGALKAAGITNLSVIHVKGIGVFEDPQTEKYDAEIIEKSSDMLKIEIICRREDVERYVEILKQGAYTGKPGDGAIFVSSVERAVKIRSGEEGIE